MILELDGYIHSLVYEKGRLLADAKQHVPISMSERRGMAR